MPRNGLVDILNRSNSMILLAQDIEKRGIESQAVYGVTGSMRSAVIACMLDLLKRPMLIVTEDLHEAAAVQLDLATLYGVDGVLLFPSLEVMPYEALARSQEVTQARLKTIYGLAAGSQKALIVPVSALLRLLPPVETLKSAFIKITCENPLGMVDLINTIYDLGYERVDKVEAHGQFAARGGIVDVFPMNSAVPYRIEYLGDDIDSIREFDPLTQRSAHNAGGLELGPGREVLLTAEDRARGAERIQRELDSWMTKLQASAKRNLARKVQDRFETIMKRIEEMGPGDDLEIHVPFLYDSLSNLVDYLPEQTVAVLFETPRLKEKAREAFERIKEEFSFHLSEGRLLPRHLDLYVSDDVMFENLKRFQRLHFVGLTREIPGENLGKRVTLHSRPVRGFQGYWRAFISEVRGWEKSDYRVAIYSSSAEKAQRVADALRAEGAEITVAPSDGYVPPPGSITVFSKPLTEGFEWPDLRICALSLGDARFSRKPRAKARKGAALSSLEELKVGDFVVHSNHGIGKYLGIESLEIEGVSRDYLFIKYAGGDSLYVPTDQLDLIQKYNGVEGREPKLNRLGGNEWAKAKKRAREAVLKLAQDLLRLYAVRQTVKGHAFPSNPAWEREFEDAFEYEETPDQRAATEEIKRDMSLPKPMDRLLCGDVGYGKTEVAMRAAFRVVMDGKQVAVLVPTTILAQQHFNTFKERFSNYPVKITVLSRFASPKAQAAVTKGLKDGSVDIVVGTHRLLQEDVKFSNLGLLIIDEEHRFGVAHKEKIKTLRQSVDVLSLSATPIPRTLHMALAGIRDMSVIETPPEDRFPVQTYVVEYNETLIKEAVTREIRRGGQVYYVHNRVGTIEDAARRLLAILPDIRVAIAHGQMKDDQLEEIMIDFYAGKHDVLVTTTIIESGLDIANVNTLIVEDSDQLGLAQLYQLRGRVGRSNRIAYAYFTYRKNKALTEVAQKRLQAIRDFTELGSGFKIAMKDLEIRGAGNILGPEQHGFIASVGFDLYCQMLEEAVKELKGEEIPQRPQISVDMGVDAFIPDSYITDGAQKIQMYKKIAGCATFEDVADVEDEILDRFGDAPQPVRNLLSIARLKISASGLGVAGIAQSKGTITLKIQQPNGFPIRAFFEQMRKHFGKQYVPYVRGETLTFRTKGISVLEGLHLMEKVFRESIDGQITHEYDACITKNE